jgi:ribonuclease P protein subunit RPR2
VKGSIKPTSLKQIAKQRIEVLFKQANDVCKVNPKLASEYVLTARKVAMSARFPLQSEFKRRICKNCNAFFVQGFNCRVRLQQKRAPHVVVTCLNCGKQSRILLNKKKGSVKIEQNKHSNETSC